MCMNTIYKKMWKGLWQVPQALAMRALTTLKSKFKFPKLLYQSSI